MPKLKTSLSGLGLLVLSIVLHAFAFPMGSLEGLYLLSFVALVPLLFWIHRVRLRWALPAGMAYGMGIYALGCYWLFNFYPAAILVAMVAASLRYGPLFLALKLTQGRKTTPLVWAVLLAATDAVSTMGFLAFPYLTLPYALYKSGLALFISSLGGMSLLSLVIASVNLLVYSSLRRMFANNAPKPGGRQLLVPAMSAIAILAFLLPPFAVSSRNAKGTPLIQAADTSRAPAEGVARIALVQPNTPHPQRTTNDYYTAFLRLKALSDPLPRQSVDLVVWHETAIVPAISWHLRFRDHSPSVYNVVRPVHDYLSAYPIPVVLGNGWSPPEEETRKIRQNVALLYKEGKEAQVYPKIKLVPFSEHFPFERIFPKLSAWLEKKFDYFWTAGTEFTIFDTGKVRFAAPVCFEDSFGPHFIQYPSPDLYIVLTQDAWAKSVAMQKQHLSMSVFRAAESGSIVLRVGNTGYTAAILPGGRVAASLPNFEQGVLIVDVAAEAYRRPTLYRSVGRHFDSVMLLAASAGLAWSIFKAIQALLDKKTAV